MKISINWLKDYVDLTKISVEEIVKRLTLSTAEIEGVEYFGKELSGVVVAQILEVSEHPNSKKLHLLKVNTGSQTLNIVCGAPNVKPNLKVALATNGANVNGIKISTAMVGGYESQGMCCSKKELNISEEHEGIWELPDSAPLGEDIKKLYPIEDVVFEVDNKSLTNRPDLVCHYGFARELSAIFHRPLKNIDLFNFEKLKNLSTIKVTNNAPDLCYRYSALKINNIERKESPIEMQIRLFYAGMRSLNFIADLTNYVMLDVGQPMHAFDANFAKEIIVKKSNNELFETLDGEKRELTKDMLLICNEEEPVAVAGVMGGLKSEINANTQDFVLESACFNPVSIRRTATKLGMRTEASSRYEKSLDPELTLTAITKVIELLNKYCPAYKISSQLADVYSFRYNKAKLEVAKTYIEKYCGIKFEDNFISNLLKDLGFEAFEKDCIVNLTAPSYRSTKDISLPADIVEEVARIYGYDNIEAKAVSAELMPVAQSKEHIFEFETKKMLAEKFALNEVHTYIWNNLVSNKKLGIQSEGKVKILSSTVKESDEIRGELAPSLIEVVSQNAKYYEDISIFEIGRVVPEIINNKSKEEKHLSIVLYSLTKKEKELYIEMKIIISSICSTLLRKNAEFEITTLNENYYHPKNSSKIFVDKIEVGKMGLCHPIVANNIDKRATMCLLELDFSKLANIDATAIKLSDVTKYQTTNLDFNFLINSDLNYADIKKVLNNFKNELQFNYKLVDIYQSKEMNNQKSYTFNFEIYSFDHTLTSEEIDNFWNSIIAYCKLNNFVLR